MKFRKKRWLMLGATVAIAALGIGYRMIASRHRVKFREVNVSRGPVALKVIATGLVQPKNRVDIKPPINGRVETVLIDEGKRVKRGQVLAWMSSTERAALIDAAQSRGAAELKKWELLYRPTPILAPITGTVIERNVESGQSFTSVDAIFVISDRLTVKAQVDETDIAQIKVGESAEVTVDAYPDKTLAAVVDQVAYNSVTVNNVTTYEVDIVPKSTPEFVRSGMTASVTFTVESRDNALLLPTEVVNQRHGKAEVLKKVADNQGGEPVELKLGITDGKNVEVLEGLTETDTVLVPEKSESKPNRSGSTNPFAPGGAGRGRRR